MYWKDTGYFPTKEMVKDSRYESSSNKDPWNHGTFSMENKHISFLNSSPTSMMKHGHLLNSYKHIIFAQ